MVNKTFDCFVNIPDLIGIKTNIKGFFWNFGKCDSPVSEDSFDRCRFKVVLEARPDNAVFSDIDRQAYSRSFRRFKAVPEKHSVIFEQNIKQLINLRFVLTVTENTVKMVVGKSYLKFIKAKLMYIHPAAYILFDVVTLLLLQNGLSTLYGSAVYLPDGKTAAFMAPPGTGKSLCVLKLRKDAGAEIVAEDMAVTDGTGLWGAPNTDWYRNYKDNSLMDFDASGFRSKIDAVDLLAILQKSDTCRVTAAEMFDEEPLLINHYSLGYYYSPCVRVLSYYNTDFSVKKAEEAERSILSRLQQNAACVLLENPDSMQFSSQVLSVMQEKSNGG